MKLNIHHVLMNFKKKLFFSRRGGSVLNTNFLVCRFHTASQEETRFAPAFREGYIREHFGSAFEGVWRQERARQETDSDRSPAGKGPARGCTLRNTHCEAVCLLSTTTKKQSELCLLSERRKCQNVDQKN